MRVWISTLPFVVVFGLAACSEENSGTGATGATGGVGGSGGAGATGGSAGASSVCAFEVTRPDGRFACAIEPAKTDAAITNTFGYHAVGLPATISADTPVYVHLVGSFGDPAKPSDQSFSNPVLLDELTELGMVVLMPAHDNEPTVGSLCKTDLACYQPVRHEILYGEDAPAPYSALKDVSPPNDIVSRLSALVSAISNAGLLGSTPPAALSGGTVDASLIRIGGHSQGGGHAALFAKQTAVARLCMLSSPTDGTLTDHVPWIDGAWATDLALRRGVVHEQDQVFSRVQVNYSAMGLAESASGWTRLTFPSTDPHAATVKDPEARAARAACAGG